MATISLEAECMHASCNICHGYFVFWGEERATCRAVERSCGNQAET